MTGLFAVDKPEGFTSFDVVAKLRGILGVRKIGHGGTLDPMATGVLPVFVGLATKAADILPDQTKRYTASGRLGIKTDTGDITGTVTERRDFRLGEAEMRRAAEHFIGESEQLPPMYSAVKSGGRRLYEIARKGETAERRPRRIEIFSIVLLEFRPDGGLFTIDVRCAKGTYIRTLVEDIAERAGTVAALTALRRTKSGPFDESSLITLSAVQAAKENGTAGALLRPVEEAFLAYPEVSLDQRGAQAFLNGVRAKAPQALPSGQTARIKSGDVFLGLAENRDGRLVKTCQFV